MSEYAKAGVDYGKIGGFKDLIKAAAKQTWSFPNRRGVFIVEDVIGSPPFEYRGNRPHRWCKVTEGLGNKNWIAEWMYSLTGKLYYRNIAIDTVLMAANDVIVSGAMPVVYTDEVAAGDSDWFTDKERSKDLVSGFYEICKILGMALVQGESPSLRFLVNAESPVGSAPSLSGCVTGIIVPSSQTITGLKLKAGDCIIGATSSGLHANGISLVIDKAMQLPEKFLTKLPNNNTLGDESLRSTRSYVSLIEALLDNEIDIHYLVPGTGGGLAKLAADRHSFTYRIRTWIKKIPLIFQFMREECGVSLKGCLETFNMGIGYYIIVPPGEVNRTIDTGLKAGYELCELGKVEEGKREVIFEPEDITLSPPSE